VPGGDLAMSHLIEAVHRRVAYVGGPFSIRQVADCRDGAVQVLQRVGRDPDDLHMTETAALNVPAAQRTAAGSIELSARSRPTAVVCASDPPALGLLQEMTGHRIWVPDDVAISGYDDIEFAAAAAVPLSSIRPHRWERGRMTAQLLGSEFPGGDTHQHHQVIFEPELVVRRQSTWDRPCLMRRLPCPPSAAEAAG
jgi:LacI family transcriptional regulator